LKPIAIEDADAEPFSDSRISPVRRLVRRLIDACESGGSPSPGAAEGYRVQCLLDAARRAHATGRWIDVAPPVGHLPNLVSPGLSKP
jgi:predicted dehydrogenase